MGWKNKQTSKQTNKKSGRRSPVLGMYTGIRLSHSAALRSLAASTIRSAMYNLLSGEVNPVLPPMPTAAAAAAVPFAMQGEN